jgi:peptidoglycan/xylan/chitin deacetylase (PgdA/CDA1 family)
MSVAIPILMHHHVSPNPGLVTVSPAVFEKQIHWLAKRGYRSIGCQEFAAFLAGEPVPAKSVLITFDDGYLDNYVYAHPILQKYGMKAVLFVVTGWIGEGAVRVHAGQSDDLPSCPNHRECMGAIKADKMDRVMLRWSEVKAMQATGTFEFHSHTHTHTRWDKRYKDDQIAKREHLQADLIQAQTMLASQLGNRGTHLCWPQGYYDQDYIEIATALGYQYLYTVEKQINDCHTDPRKIGRIVIKNKANSWFAWRMWMYRHSLIGKAYLALRGQS